MQEILEKKREEFTSFIESVNLLLIQFIQSIEL